MDADSYRRTTLTAEQIAEHDRVYGELTERTRDLMDAQLRTEVDHDEVAEISRLLGELTDRLLAKSTGDPLGAEIGVNGEVRNHGNTVIGLRNPIAPPLHVRRSPDGHARAVFHLNGLFEGPPGLVHGGVSALILDQMLGEAAAAAGAPGMTARFSLNYHRPTPLGDLSAHAWVEEIDGVKTAVRGHLLDPEGNPTVEAEGLFILPRWARGPKAEPRPDSFE